MKQTLSLVLSATALVMATLGSTPLGEAAKSMVTQVPRNSVGPLQLKRNAVTARTLSPNSVRAGHVLDGSLLAADFKAGQLPAGPKGDKGDRGDTGTPATRLWARVGGNGALVRGSGVASVAHTIVGEYSIVFDRDVDQCATVVSTEYVYVSAAADSGITANPRIVEITTGRTTGPGAIVRQDVEFNLALFC